MKVFDVMIGDTKVIKNMDPFLSAGEKLLPGDEFLDIKVKKGGKLLVNDEVIKGGLKNGKLEIKFSKGKNDNPKVNAIMLVQGGVENTHKGTYEAYKEAMVQAQEEKAEARMKAEQFFAEDAYDYEERIDGRGPFNQFLSYDWGLEVAVAGFLLVFFHFVMPSQKKKI